MKAKSFFHILFFCCLLFFITDCASYKNAPTFQHISNKPLDKAVIYIYWPENKDNKSEFYRGNIIGSIFTIKANDIEIGTIKHQGYFYYLAEPGKINISSKVKYNFGDLGLQDVALAPKKNIELDVKGGVDYFVQCNEGRSVFGKLDRLEMTTVSSANDIKDCKLLE